jgi:thymidylate synthase ThyX
MISAKIVADSVCPNDKRITTFELEYPRFIHSEFMTHRMVSKNAASSRAIPVEKMIEHVMNVPALPVFWGRNQAGMTAQEELDVFAQVTAKGIWLSARNQAVDNVKKLVELGVHKQIANRILEPWTHIKVVATATEWDNFFHLRRHKDAQPEFRALANEMYFELLQSRPQMLYEGQYHLPYITTRDRETFTPGDCLKLSASLCAQVSFRKADMSIAKAMAIYGRLVSSTPVHASPFEHQAKPLNDANARSGNFFGWEQYRQTIPGNVCNAYTPP